MTSIYQVPYTTTTLLVLAGATTTLLAIVALYQVIYRLYLHPLAKFPGPKLGAISRAYEFYYDFVKRGQMAFQVGRLHERYGPIIRIGPGELHVNDPEFIDKLYTGPGQKRDKDVFYTERYNFTKNIMFTRRHDHHRRRRAVLGPYFSVQSVRALEPGLLSTVNVLCDRLKSYANTGVPVTISSAFNCFTADIMTEYALGRSYDCLNTTSPTFSPNLCEMLDAATEVGVFLKYAPWLYKVINAMPDKLATKIDPRAALVLRFQRDLQVQVREVLSRANQDSKSSESVALKLSIFEGLRDSDIPAADKSAESLWQEGQVLVTGGTGTTSWALSVITCSLLSQPPCLARLRSELKDAIPDPNALPRWSVLEKLPYLIWNIYTAVIQEGLRLSYGLSTRLARVSPDLPLQYKNWTIPPGTPIGMTSLLVHQNESIFPNPGEFRPERWLGDRDRNGAQRLEKYLLSFSRGTRMCLGVNLAYAQLYLCLAALFRRFEMELFETDTSDVEMRYDMFLPEPKRGSKGVRVLIK